jgi:Arc/MetJ-type ribon-helix-helix transcriptional regulator
MTKVLREAIAKVEALPEAAQEHIARELIDYVDKLNALRADLESGIKQIDAGEARELDVDEFLRRMHEQRRKG